MAIVVVSGLPRSGTSMMMQMLEAGGMQVLTDGIRAPDEDNPRGYYEIEKVKQLRRDARWLAEAEGKAVKIVYSSLYDLPADRSYKLIFMRRDLREVLASQRQMLERSGREGSALSAERLAEVFAGQLGKIDRWLCGQRQIDTLRVDYAEAVGEAQTVAGRVNAFLGTRLSESAMAAAVDQRLYRKRSARPPAEGMTSRPVTEG
jgi:hypothetical protein